MAITEDIGPGDITSQCILPEEERCIADFITREDGIMAGGKVVKRLYEKIAPSIKLEQKIADGEPITAGAILATISGSAREILAGERIALNILQRMCGIATLTHKYVKAVNGTKAKIADTRKTVLGWRALDKMAVVMGGGINHRHGLFDILLIKDNHIALAIKECEVASASWAVRTARAQTDLPIGVEVDTIDQLQAVLEEEPDIVLLDNMTPEMLHKVVALTDKICKAEKLRRPLLEASGGITLANVKAIAESGVDRLSVGAITHSVPALDIGLDIE
ncbi:MAG: carboxylating nicotinate-nucleotide diphosphorylase [Planctomycetes bacterium]|nr:carboxylating nicotinate-nucleotide diphosphorylase [Planctomycetota bacterium]